MLPSQKICQKVLLCANFWYKLYLLFTSGTTDFALYEKKKKKNLMSACRTSEKRSHKINDNSNLDGYRTHSNT